MNDLDNMTLPEVSLTDSPAVQGNVVPDLNEATTSPSALDETPTPTPDPVKLVVVSPIKQSSSMPFTITSISKTQRYLKALVYGGYGTGKTFLGASAADVEIMSDVIYISAESGTMSIANRHEIDEIEVKDFATFSKVFQFLRKHCAARDAKDFKTLAAMQKQLRPESEIKTRADIKQYKTVVIDSLTEVQKYCMYQLLGIEIGSQELDLEVAQPQFAEWGKSADMIRLLVRSFRDLPMHVIFIASEQIKENERKQQLRSPNLPGKLAGEVQGFLDLVGFLYAKEVKDGEVVRRLYTQPGAAYQAKSRLPSVPSFIDNPTLSDIMKGF